MSGFVGLVGSGPAERDWLEQATRFLEFRGPDARGTWHGETAALGHALLATTREEQGRAQPLSLNGDVWLTGDIRLDARAELVGRLVGCGRPASLSLPDAELVLHSYHAWGDRCLERLAGDFAFAVWDQRSRRLFAARDHFGVSQFFYAMIGKQLLFSNTLDALLLHPGIPDALDETALGDYLVSGWGCEPAATVFAGIRRLPPAHCLSRSDGHFEIRRYWTIPPPGPLIRYSRPETYAEHFLALLREAVADRLRTDRVSAQL
ncbi:MAG TPA: hypothetical protein VGP61_00560, partial [Gemmatimonadales bacterium]|nr:hypothetical protein [Gemmatimonadales bacterium]